MELARPGAELLFELFEGLGFEYTEVDELPNDWHLAIVALTDDAPEPILGWLTGSAKEFSISRVND